MKKLLLLFLLIGLLGCSSTNYVVFAVGEELEDVNNAYTVYTADGSYLFERSDIALFDNYVSKDFKMYEIVSLNNENKTAVARYVKTLNKPKVSVNPNPEPVGASTRKICLYLTHNDESFTPSDGYDSVYGAGGIHDVAKELKKSFQELGIDVVLDETLHIPHDTSAYNRSQKTAKNLLNNHNPDAIFDIHRDGVSRKYYATEVDGLERSKIRIVVGKANPNMDENLEFATYLLSVAEEQYPWLFSDIYYAKGHYNQGLYNKSLLFEMGTYLIEKELVLGSVRPLAEVVNTALFGTTVNEDSGEIVIGGTQTEATPTVNEHLNKLGVRNKKTAIIANVVVWLVAVLTAVVVVGLLLADKKYVKSAKSNNVSHKKLKTNKK